MKAATYSQYGGPEVLQIQERDTPAPGEQEVRIRVKSSTVTTVDCIFRRGNQLAARLFTGPIRPKKQVPGTDLAGIVDAVGTRVTRFKTGDEVIASVLGANAEFVCLPETEAIAARPRNLSWEESTAFVEGGLTALPFLRDKAGVQPGQQVLIIGASGSVGSAAVQLAKVFGAEVTGVVSSANFELIKSLGADHAIDYRQEDFSERTGAFDVIFDAAGKSSFNKSKNALKKGGVFLEVLISPTILFQMLMTSIVGSRKAVFAATGARPAAERASDLAWLAKLVEEGQLRPVVDRVYPLEEVAKAHAYVEEGSKKGSVVLSISGSIEVKS